MTAADTLPALKADERDLLEAMAAFKAGNVLEEQVRAAARRLLKMAGPIGDRADELGTVDDTPEGVIVRPAVGIDSYIVVAPEHPDGDGKVGLMLHAPLRGNVRSPLPVFRRRPGGGMTQQSALGVAEEAYSTVPAVEQRIDDLAARLEAIADERDSSSSIPQLEALEAEKASIERDLLVLRNRLPLLQHAEDRKASIVQDERRQAENAALAALYRDAEMPFACILDAARTLHGARDTAAAAGVRVSAIPAFELLDDLVQWISEEYPPLLEAARTSSPEALTALGQGGEKPGLGFLWRKVQRVRVSGSPGGNLWREGAI